MAWLFLALAGIEEVISVVVMKQIDGWKRKWPIALMVGGFACSFFFLSKAMQVIPAGVAYAIWTAIGTIGISIVGVFLFREKLNSLQWVFLACILIGAIGLRAAA
ncbi:DMT family transporter [Brevibacillus sp. B_LB10_24]|uniref:DMT family transporter n=1 Tax=Brevibacillus sp. B_LB10_24 TaxID=3380645 RepID=UPI0038B6BB74